MACDDLAVRPHGLEGLPPPRLDGFERRWNDQLLAAEPAVLRVLDDQLADLARRGIHLPYGGDALALTPDALDQRWIERFAGCIRSMFVAMEHVVATRFGGDIGRLADFFRMSPDQRELLGLGGDWDWAMVARPDVVIGSSTGGIVETNVSSALGLLESSVVGRLLWRSPPMANMAREFGLCDIDPAKRLAATVTRALPDRRALVVFADWERDMEECAQVYAYLRELLGQRGVRAATATVEELVVDATGVRLGGERVGVLYRFFTTISGREDQRYEVFAPIVDAMRRGQVTIVGGFRHKVYTPKSFLALLSEYVDAGHLPPQLAADVAAIVPWTRIVAPGPASFGGRSVDLLDFAREHRAKLVIKPDVGFGGDRIHVGRTTTDTAWDGLVATAAADDEVWLLQEHVEAAPAEIAWRTPTGLTIMPATVDHGVFMLDRRFAGMCRRHSTRASGPTVTNASQGGGLGGVLYGR